MSKPVSEQPKSPPARLSMISLLPNLLAVILGLAAILFISAGRLGWIQAWAFVLAFGGSLTFYGLWVLRNDPGQLSERSRVGQNTKSWDLVILTTYTIFLVAMLVLAGLDAGRFKWSTAPLALQILGWLGAAFAGFVVLRTASVNTYLSRTARIQDDRGQRVIDTGPYKRVRHPMYLGVIVLMVSIPLLLGSLWALVPGALIGILFVVRTILEDHMLLKELPGYPEYADRVRYRLLPWIW
jgi:protein-S-isoprenylcysteine O-methyltransferase Ste14